MRQPEDRELRDFEIRQWYYLLVRQHVSEGMSPAQASEQAYDDIGLRYSLRKTSIRKARNAGLKAPQNKTKLMFEVRNNIQRLRDIICYLEKSLDEQPDI